MKMNIKLEPLAGETIGDSFDHALRVAAILNLTAEFQFNEVCCMVSPKADKTKFLTDWNKAVTSKSKYKFASA